MMAYGFGGGGLLWFLILAALLVVPFWKLLPRFGIPAPVALVAIIPLGALVLLWIIAFKDNGGTA
jgi:hypothetical protein